MGKILFIITSAFFFSLFLGCKSSTTDPNDNSSYSDSSHINVRKPNLYIYPTQKINLSVSIVFPNGGRIIDSSPAYKKGWNIYVEPTGKINETYDYLFYECNVPDLTQYRYGWVIAQKELNRFFKDNLSASGFNKKEINDFTEYWNPLLKEFNYYEIYPQYILTIEKMSILNFSIQPNNIFRLLYVIKGRDKNDISLITPQKQTADRQGFYIMEWGVTLK